MDVDIDTATSFDPTKIFPSWLRASVVRDGKMTPHPCGVYPQAMAQDPMTKLSAIPYAEAEELGYLKIDFLHLQMLNNIGSHAELEKFCQTEPNWKLLQLQSVHPKLFQLSKHGEMLISLKPSSILELADCMALIRPGKKNFIGLYKKDRSACRKVLYSKDEAGYSFKRSHALAYSYNVVIQLHLIEQGRL
jgi:DNA polymerase III alpha subunit